MSLDEFLNSIPKWMMFVTRHNALILSWHHNQGHSYVVCMAFMHQFCNVIEESTTGGAYIKNIPYCTPPLWLCGVFWAALKHAMMFLTDLLNIVMNIIMKVPALQNMHASQEYLFHCFSSCSECYTVNTCLNEN